MFILQYKHVCQIFLYSNRHSHTEGEWFNFVWREFASSRRPWNYCKNKLKCFCIFFFPALNQEEHAVFAKRCSAKTLWVTENPFLLRIVLPSFILCVLMSTLCSVLALASSIGWLMSQLASEMFFLHYLLLITQL